MHWTWYGKPKQPLANEEAAAETAARLFAMDGGVLESYRCEECDWWHVGHQARTRGKRMRPVVRFGTSQFEMDRLELGERVARFMLGENAGRHQGRHIRRLLASSSRPGRSTVR
jgi:hypothetical protein